jgi:imidazole glycerol-phosphate synthase subunit HisH
MIVIIDYRMGNPGSILNMLKKIGVPAIISSQPDQIWAADKLILPGVGAFDAGMANIKELGLLDLLNEAVLVQKKYILGVCLGMQLMARSSEEGVLPGLGWIEADSVRFRFQGQQNHLRIPHMGWNEVSVCKNNTLFKGLEGAHFYFVHSYHLVCDHPDNVIAYTSYGYDFASAIRHDNILGTQFHPEKSHKYGMRLYQNFIGL